MVMASLLQPSDLLARAGTVWSQFSEGVCSIENLTDGCSQFTMLANVGQDHPGRVVEQSRPFVYTPPRSVSILCHSASSRADFAEVSWAINVLW
jgi:hypothetical protein